MASPEKESFLMLTASGNHQPLAEDAIILLSQMKEPMCFYFR